MDRDDVGVVERRRRARLLLEALQAVRVLRERRRQHLDRDLAPEPRVLRPVDLSHPAGAERREDLVGAELCAGGERHRVPRDSKSRRGLSLPRTFRGAIHERKPSRRRRSASARSPRPLLAQTPRPITVAWCYSDDGRGGQRRCRRRSGPPTATSCCSTRRTPAAKRALERVQFGDGRAAPGDGCGRGLGEPEDRPRGGPGRRTRSPGRTRSTGAGRLAVYVLDGDLFLLDLAVARFERLTHPEIRSRSRACRPTGRRSRSSGATTSGSTTSRRRRRPRMTSDGSAHGAQRGPLLGLLGGGLQPRRGGLLVVGRLEGDRLPPHRRGGRGRGRSSRSSRPPSPRSSRSATRRPATRIRRSGSAIADLATGKTAWMSAGLLRVRPRRDVAARQPRRRRPDDRPAADAPRSLAGRSRGRPRDASS